MQEVPVPEGRAFPGQGVVLGSVRKAGWGQREEHLRLSQDWSPGTSTRQRMALSYSSASPGTPVLPVCGQTFMQENTQTHTDKDNNIKKEKADRQAGRPRGWRDGSGLRALAAPAEDPGSTRY